MDAAARVGLTDFPCNQGLRREDTEGPTALVVSYDPAKRNQVEGWLEAGGLSVAGCPGPGVPVVCPQMHGAACPLTNAADVVVLGLELMGNFAAGSAPGWVLLDTYLERGARVVVLTDPEDDPPLLHERMCTVLSRAVDQRRLLATVRTVLASG